MMVLRPEPKAAAVTKDMMLLLMLGVRSDAGSLLPKKRFFLPVRDGESQFWRICVRSLGELALSTTLSVEGHRQTEPGLNVVSQSRSPQLSSANRSWHSRPSLFSAAAQFGMGRVAKEDSSPWSAGTGLHGLRQPRLADSTRAGKLAHFGNRAAQMHFVV